MRKNEPILIFGYSFPHRKTYDFLHILFALGFQNITVIASPKIQLAHDIDIKNANKNNSNAYCVKTACRSLQINLIECFHDDLKTILKVQNQFQAKSAIISGARIIKKDVIDLFEDGIVNFHPGKIPETSGLDSFYYSIKNDCPMGVTAHLIDHKVDAGKFIFFEKLRVEKSQQLDTVKENLYGTQLIALKKYLMSYYAKESCFEEIMRPKKNLPLKSEEKLFLVTKFDQWVINQTKVQEKVEDQFFSACADGKIEIVRNLINVNSYLLNCYNSKGWSGIIIASFWQHIDIVNLFIELGANPNDYGRNGTTVLMYAKTKLLEQTSPNMSLLKILINAGANIHQKDNFNKDIFDYLNIENLNEKKVIDYLIKN